MTELCKLAEKYIVDKCPKYNHYYTEEYDKILKDKKYSCMLEIGIGYQELMKKFTNENYKSGASLFMWRDYFKDCIIHGADIKEFNINEENIKIHQCDQSKVDSLEIMMNTIGNVDFIIDDGSHVLEHQILTFQTLNKYCKDIYIIEDVKPENLQTLCSLSDDNWIVSSFKHSKDTQGFVCFQKINRQKILYINLDQRTDRRNHIEKLFPEAERVSAIKDKRGGYFGCVRSHILCLRIAMARRYESVIILEDDFNYKDNRRLQTMDIPEEYDMLLLSNLIKSEKDMTKYNDKFDRVFKCVWTSGHLVHNRFYQKLIDVFEESLKALDKENKHCNYLDVYWSKIFPDHLILKHKNMIGTQLENDFSDINNRVVKRTN
jgi:GR25 family glycosyltransferase involved in LPS biosynthesis